MSKNSVRIWIICSMLLALGVAPFLARGDQNVEQQLEKNRQTIARMSPSERDRLERNFKAYQQMSPENVVALNQFQKSLEKDSTGELKDVLELYEEWLSTIEPHQRDQLKETTDPAKRIELVREIRKGQRHREAIAAMRAMPNSRWRGTPFYRIPILSSSELATVMEKIEALERSKLSDENRSELNREEGLGRYLTLIKLLKQNTRVREQDRSKIPPYVVPELHRTFQQLIPYLKNDLKNGEVKKHLSERNEINGKDITTLRIQAILIKSMIEEAIANQPPSRTPGQGEIENYFNSLDEESQNRLMELEGIDFYIALESQVSSVEHPESITTNRVRETFFPNRGEKGRPGDRGRPGGGSPRGERPSGSGFDNRNPGERPQGGRRPGDGPPGLRGEFGRGDGPPPNRDGDRPPRGGASDREFDRPRDDSTPRPPRLKPEDRQ